MIKFKPGVSFGDFVVTDVMTKQPREKTEMPIDYRRGLVVWLVVLAAMGLLLMRLGSLQLITGGKYRVLAAGHVVGYLGEINEQEVGLLREQGQKYEIGSQIGRSGLEQEYEDQLRGIDGGQLVEVDPHQEVVRNLGKSDPKPGKDLQTSLDANLQTVAYTALAGRKGAVVVANPKTGEILALVSSPGFDPQNIKKSLSDTSMPLLNRAIGGIYPPGSTFKMVTTIAALMEKKADKNFTYDDKGVINIGSFAYTNWYFNQYGKTEGVVGWEKALARSVDTFFYKVGEMVGPDLMAAWAKDLGMGEKTKIDLPGEVTGLIPTPAADHSHTSKCDD
ncbi:MAG: Cell elongation specific D,D-transpeptidase [Candidatus Pacebacteria bacterium GW2011_GWA1_46_10]|nr:MAG: Cell elongation specific D,D-transpeptidase [Candidatus Pacebacteria bacterium GW2011_GWA1_46_10]